DNEGRLSQDMSRANRAQTLVDNPLFREAFEATKDQIAKDFDSTSSSDLEGLQRLKIRQEVLAEFMSHFQQLVITGRMSQSEMEVLKERAKRH
ncbi:hypothetical protein LCGC14_2263120, partial [marine sediment metagenome]